MFRGVLRGGVAGVAVSAVALVAVSLVTEPPAGSRPPMPPVVEPPGMAPGSGEIVGTAPADVPGGSLDAGGAPTPSETPEVAIPGAEPALPQADTALPQAPVAAQDGETLSLPDAPAAAPQVAGAESPVLTAPPARAPEPPVAEAELTVPSEPVAAPPSDIPPDAPVLPERAADVTPPSGLASEEVAEAPVVPSPGQVPAPAPEALDIAGTAPADRPAAEVESLADPQVAELADAAPAVPGESDPGASGQVPALGAPSIDELLPSTGSAPESLPEVVLIVPEAGAAEVAPEAAAEAPATDVTEAPAPASAPRIALGGETASLPGSASGVRITRPGAAEPEPAAETAEPAPELPDDAPALLRYAAEYENPEAKPLMSIVLIDDGTLGAGALPALQSVSLPVTVAIDGAAPDAAALMQVYRAAGFEVMVIASLPEGALPSDADVTLEAIFAAVPEAIGLLDAGSGGLQSDRAVTEQAMARLAADGRGFLTVSQGLNTAIRSAEGADVPAEVIYRDLDAEDQDARVIRRFLDQAAFRARQQGEVVLLGRVRPDTLSALTLWGTANRAGQVVIAPVSATLNQ